MIMLYAVEHEETHEKLVLLCAQPAEGQEYPVATLTPTAARNLALSLCKLATTLEPPQ